jgi:hypothetical protein
MHVVDYALSREFAGLLLRYLEMANIALVVGDVLFVHGAVTEDNMRC